MSKLKPIEIEYHELISFPNKAGNVKYGMRTSTTPETYEEDFVALVIEVKSRIQMIKDKRLNKNNENQHNSKG